MFEGNSGGNHNIEIMSKRQPDQFKAKVSINFAKLQGKKITKKI